MTTKSYQEHNPFGDLVQQMRLNRGIVFGVIIITALLAFELFNYSTTDFALSDLLGDLTFLGIRWATILSIAFCSIDFAGIARLFTPEDGTDSHKEVWYLFGAWMLAATMNAMLTWWGVSIAILNHNTLGNAVVERATLLRVVPIFVAVLVWIIRVLIIGTFSVAGDRLFSYSHVPKNSYRIANKNKQRATRSIGSSRSNSHRLPASRSAKPARSFTDHQAVNKSSRGVFKPNAKEKDHQVNSRTQPDPQIPLEPEYVGLDHPYQSTVAAAQTSAPKATAAYRESPNTRKRMLRS